MKIITVDGPAASGKSTVARHLAQRLGFQYVNSGALYRAFALGLARRSIRLEDHPAVESALSGVSIEVGPNDERTFLDGEDVTAEIRTKEVSELASKVARIPAIRAQVNAKLRAIAASTSCVIDGRDIGTVVFPDADFKLYLEATLEERSRRRLLDYQRAGCDAFLEDIQAELARRDSADASRELAPLKLPKDAVVVNSTGQSVEQIVAKLLEQVQEAFTSEEARNPEVSVGLNC
ncbi:MAG: (d)CMP kinase [Candidatus Wallbacteria bacterium]|nr:(d)CMP kinase [Candidatus Wallbacteria bacterium]